MSEFLELLKSPLIWRGCDARVSSCGRPSGVAGLDQYLPDGGWPRRAVTELQLSAHGIGEMSLLLPLLAAITRADPPGWVTLIAPPDLPYAHALSVAGVDLKRLLVIHDVDPTQGLWAAEQCLRCGHSPVVLLWTGRIRSQQWRRLQLAAEAGDSSGLIWQPIGEPAGYVALSLRLRPTLAGVVLQINRGRGSLRRRDITIALDQPGQACVVEN